MARNLEIKVRCDETELAAVRERALVAGAVFASIRQTDTYFVVAHGRLKVREIDAGDSTRSAELISYRRPDRTGPRWSDYQRLAIPLEMTEELISALASSCGRFARVDKRRDVAILRRTRLHLDRVAGLGCFVELETVAGDGDDDSDLAAEHGTMIAELGLAHLDVVAGSYSDLIGTIEGEKS